MSIASSLADGMGGSIGVASIVGEGSTFWFELPAPASTSPAAKLSSDHTGRLDDVRVLVVDDNATNLLVLGRQLEQVGAAVRRASSGQEALSLLDIQAVDVVLMDYQMPEMDGPATTRALRHRGVLIPVIGLTASVMESDWQACLDAGMSSVLTKPVPSARLAEAVRSSLRRHPPEFARNAASPG